MEHSINVSESTFQWLERERKTILESADGDLEAVSHEDVIVHALSLCDDIRTENQAKVK